MPDFLLQAAVAAFQAGDYDRCVALCLAASPGSGEEEGLLTLLAMAQQTLGRAADAAESFGRLTMLKPSVPEYWSNLGVSLRETGRFTEAEQAFRHSLSLAPKAYGTSLNYGLLLLDLGRLGDARHCFLDAHETDPDALDARIHGALACFECGDVDRAEALIPAPGRWLELDLEMRNRLVTVLTHIGRLEEAERLLGDAATSGNPSAIARLALLHERTNRLDSARTLMDGIRAHLHHDDADIRADALTVDIALALRARDFVGARESVEALLRMPLPPAVLATNHFTAASIADKTGDVAGAMTHLAQAHETYLRIASDIVPEIAASADKPLRLAAKWMDADQCQFAAASDAPSFMESPVFIVGFPRSGTTMLEQMLDAHPGFASMDERTVIQHCVERMEADGFAYPEDLSRLAPEDCQRLREQYWSEARRYVELAPGQVLVDKNPLNMLRLPMISRLFPSARIILALRHPCDVVLSCYMQNFRSPAFMVLCSTLERLAKSYVNAMRFWIHHEALLKPDVLLLRYEQTVSDFDAQVERIADYLGIEDRSHLARFSEHALRKGYISTPSYSQVIEPVNRRAMGRWHAYRAFFEPVLPILQPVADHWGYEFGGG